MISTMAGQAQSAERLTAEQPRGRTGINFCWICADGISEALPHDSLFCGQLWTPSLSLFGKCNSNLVTSCFFKPQIFPFLNPFLPLISRNVGPHIINYIKYTPSCGTSPFAYARKVPSGREGLRSRPAVGGGLGIWKGWGCSSEILN